MNYGLPLRKQVKANDLQIFKAVFCNNKTNVREGNQNNLKM